MIRQLLSRLEALTRELMKEPSGARFRWRWVVVPLLTLVALTLFVRFTNFDAYSQEAIFRAGQGSWALGDHPFWNALYTFGTIPTTVVVISALIGFFLSWSKKSFRRWRRTFLFFVLVAVVGPGILTNAVLKEYWGRPRPREVESMGGHQAFEQVLTIDPTSVGKSFPCGHATMGFYFFCGFFLLRRHRRRLANGFLWGGLILGGLMGLARMAQGAHFFSDVVWAGAICWFTPMGLYYAMKLDRGLVRRGLPAEKMPLWIRLSATAAGIAILSGVILASPYRDIRNFYIVNDFARSGPINVRLRFVAGEIDIVPGEKFHIEGEAYGHGMPTSNISENYVEVPGKKFPTVAYVERMSGFLTEANQNLTVTMPWERINELRLECFDATVRLRLGKGAEKFTVRIPTGSGTIHLDSAGQPFSRRGGEFGKQNGFDEATGQPPGAKEVICRIIVEEDFAGRIEYSDSTRSPGTKNAE